MIDISAFKKLTSRQALALVPMTDPLPFLGLEKPLKFDRAYGNVQPGTLLARVIEEVARISSLTGVWTPIRFSLLALPFEEPSDVFAILQGLEEDSLIRLVVIDNNVEEFGHRLFVLPQNEFALALWRAYNMGYMNPPQ